MLSQHETIKIYLLPSRSSIFSATLGIIIILNSGTTFADYNFLKDLMRINISLVSIIAVFLSCNALLAEELTVYGSRIAANILLTPYKKTLEQKTGLNVRIEEKNCGKGLCDLLEGKCDVALAVGDLNATLDAARKWDRDIASTNLFYHPIVSDDIVFFVNTFNVIEKLSIAQIKDILTGKITNWKAVGGDDAPIQVYMDVTAGPIYSAIKTSLFDNQDHPLNCARVSSINQAIDYVIIQTDRKIERQMGAITHGQGSEKVQKLLDVISAEIKKTKSLSRHQISRKITASL